MPRTKNQNSPPKIFAGHVRQERVRCGRANCKCSRGELHGPYFYHYVWHEGRRSKMYVRPADVAETRAACEAHRRLQQELLAGRREWAATLRRARELFALLDQAERAGLL